MLTLLGILAALAVLFVAASVATRDGEVLVEAPRDRADLNLPRGALQPQDIGGLRFGMAVRGYRMSEVDDVLDRVRAELALRDARLLELQEKVAASTTTVAGQDQAERGADLPSLPLHAAIDPTVAPVLEGAGGLVPDEASFDFPDIPPPERAAPFRPDGGTPGGGAPAAAGDSGT